MSETETLGGVITVSAPRLAQAVVYVEALGCTVLLAGSVPEKNNQSGGGGGVKYALYVSMGLAAANRVACATVRGDLIFQHFDQFAASIVAS